MTCVEQYSMVHAVFRFPYTLGSQVPRGRMEYLDMNGILEYSCDG